MTPLSTQNIILQGEGGDLNFFIGILIFFFVWSLCKIFKPYDNPFLEKNKKGREKERKFYAAEVILGLVELGLAWLGLF